MRKRELAEFTGRLPAQALLAPAGLGIVEFHMACSVLDKAMSLVNFSRGIIGNEEMSQLRNGLKGRNLGVGT